MSTSSSLHASIVYPLMQSVFCAFIVDLCLHWVSLSFDAILLLDTKISQENEGSGDSVFFFPQHSGLW